MIGKINHTDYVWFHGKLTPVDFTFEVDYFGGWNSFCFESKHVPDDFPIMLYCNIDQVFLNALKNNTEHQREILL